MSEAATSPSVPDPTARTATRFDERSCQLALALDGTERRPTAHRAASWLLKRGRRTLGLVRRAVREPLALVRRITNRPGRGKTTLPSPEPLRAQSGQRVRVKSVADIRATLDAKGQYRGLSFMPEMERFTGRELTVRKRVELFFDERTREMRRVRDVVILDGAFCEGRPSDPWDYAGCDRSCFLFWKEAWLERVP